MPGIYAARDGIIGVQSALGGRGGLRWLLRDEFTSDLAAGSVNGTLAEPGPGTRTVVDTENKLSITGGAATFAGGASVLAHGNPGFWYGAQTRVAGRMVLASVSVGAPITTMHVGWDINQSGVVDNESVNFNSSSALRTSGVVVFSPHLVNTTYLTAVALRATGSLIFFKGGAFTYWTLLYRNQTYTTTPLFPGVSGYDSTHNINFLRVPAALWLPTPLASDGFGSAFGTTDGLGGAEGVSGGIGAGGSGVVMSNVGATWSVSAGKAINTPVPGADIAVNGSFTAWTGDTPDNWTVSNEVGADPMVNEVGTGESHGGAGTGAANIYTTGASITLQQNVDKNKWYRISAVISAISGSLAFSKGSTSVGGSLTAIPATYAATMCVLNIESALGFKGNGAVDATIDSITIQALTLSELISVTNSACADVMAGAALTRSISQMQIGLALNWDSASIPANGVIVYIDGTNIKVDKCVAGVWSSVSTTAYTYSAGARLVVWHKGTEYRTYYNNVLVKVDTIADAGILTGTYHGLFSTDASNTLDDLTIYAVGTSGEHSALDAWSA